MTCVRLASGAVVLHSPIRATPELVAAVGELGPVRWVVAPNGFHHLYLAEWCERCPEATPLVAPRALQRRKALRALKGVTTLDEAPDAWGDELEMIAIEGLPAVGERVFFHRSTATLILTDLAFNFSRDSPFLTRWMIRFTGRLGELAPTLLERLLARDRAAFRGSIERLLEWPFERVVVAHGDVVESGGREALRRGYDWLLETT